MAWNKAPEKRDLHIYYSLLLIQYVSTCGCLLTPHWAVITGIRGETNVRLPLGSQKESMPWYELDLVGELMDSSDITDNITETMLQGVNMYLESWRLERIISEDKDNVQ